jgi:ATP-dependent Clp protease ATP-binding subunit ClpA
MFERFTQEARAVLVEARAECRRRHDRMLGAGHLLLGLWVNPGDPAVRALERLGLHREDLLDQLPGSLPDPDALRTLGIDLDEVRRRVEAAFGQGALDQTSGGWTRVRFTPTGKKALDLAFRSTLELGHKSVEPTHVLLGIVRADDTDVARVLELHGVAPGDVRQAVLAEFARAA